MANDEQNMAGIDPTRIIVGLDIGSSKIGVFIGELDDNNKVCIRGLGINQLKKGDANELEATITALTKAVDDAEKLSGVDVKEVYVGIAGSNIRSVASQATIPLREYGGVVTKDVMKRVVEQASQLVQRESAVALLLYKLYRCVDNRFLCQSFSWHRIITPKTNIVSLL